MLLSKVQYFFSHHLLHYALKMFSLSTVFDKNISCFMIWCNGKFVVGCGLLFYLKNGHDIGLVDQWSQTSNGDGEL